jgi:uncharacterized protein YggE
MKRTIGVLLAALIVLGSACAAQAQQQEPVLTVSGRGEVSAAPDTAVVRLGALSQAETAAEAQGRVDAVIGRLLQAIKALGVAEEKIATAQMTLTPIYRDRPRGAGQEPQEPVIVGYRAGNIVRVTVEDLQLLGKVIDGGLAAGANRVEGISFDLKDDSRQRRQALGLAARDAQAKAESIAVALGVKLGRVRSVAEGGVNLLRPRLDGVTAYAAAREAVAIQPGQLQIDASLTVTYDIADGPPPPRGPHPPRCPCGRPPAR